MNKLELHDLLKTINDIPPSEAVPAALMMMLEQLERIADKLEYIAETAEEIRQQGVKDGNV